MTPNSSEVFSFPYFPPPHAGKTILDRTEFAKFGTKCLSYVYFVKGERFKFLQALGIIRWGYFWTASSHSFL